MPSYLVRVRLPDRPGALGLVASRIGAVGGDITALDILERHRGTALDELVVDLPGSHLVRLLRSEVEEVDGVKVEAVVPLAPPPDGPPAAPPDAPFDARPEGTARQP